MVVRKGWAGSGRRSLLLISLPGQGGNCPPAPPPTSPRLRQIVIQPLLRLGGASVRAAARRPAPAALVSHSSVVATYHGRALLCSARAAGSGSGSECAWETTSGIVCWSEVYERFGRRGAGREGQSLLGGRWEEGGGEWGWGLGSEREGTGGTRDEEGRRGGLKRPGSGRRGEGMVVMDWVI